jgi:putative transposase
LEVLKNEKTLQEIASTNNITPKNLQNWKKIFLENAEIAMEPAGVLRSQHRVYDDRGEVARTQDVWGAEGISSR